MSEGYSGLPSYYTSSAGPITPNLGLSLRGMDPVMAEDFVLIDTAFGGGGTTVQINGAVIANPNFNNAAPAAPLGGTNVIWQHVGSSVSAYVVIPAAGVFPVTKATIASNWLNSYDAVTGLFTATQPSYSDLSGTPTINTWAGLTGTLSNGQVIPYADAGISRLGAASLAIGNGTQGDFSGTLKTTIVNAVTGFQINNAAASGNVLLGNGTNFVSAQLSVAQVTGAAPLASPTFTGTVSAPTLNVTTSLSLNGTVTLLDGAGLAGTSGYVLSSTGTGTLWVPSGGGSAPSDTFKGTGNLNSNWVTIQDDSGSGGTFNRFGGTYGPATSGGGPVAAYWSSTSFGDDQSSGFTVDTVGTTSSGVGVCVRHGTGGAKTCYFFYVGKFGGSFFRQFQKIVAGAATVLASDVLTVNVGDVYVLSATGTTIAVTKNGSALFSVTDSEIAHGSPGLMSYSLGSDFSAKGKTWTVTGY